MVSQGGCTTVIVHLDHFILFFDIIDAIHNSAEFTRLKIRWADQVNLSTFEKKIIFFLNCLGFTILSEERQPNRANRTRAWI